MGKKALEILEKQKIDCAMIACNMLTTNDLQLLNEFKNKQTDIKYILLVNSYNKKKMEDILLEKNIKITKVLEKPFTPSSLYNIIFDFQNEQKIETKSSYLSLNVEKSVLVVEDNETNQIVAKAILEKIGFKVDIANDGLEAVEKVKNNTYDIIFMDLQMPNLDGFGATQRIREFNSSIPIIALSAAVMEKDKVMTKQVGMDGHISKPIIKEEFETLISKYFDVSYTKIGKHKTEYEVNIYGINFKELMQNLSFDSNQALSLVIKYYKNYNNIETILDDIDLSSEDFNRYLHKLKGVSGNIQAMKIYDICNSIENTKIILIKEQLLAKLKVEMRMILQSIKTNIINKPKIDNLRYNDKEILKIINEIIKDLKEDNFIRSSRIEQLVEVLNSLVDEDIIKNIETYFSNYDYSELIDSLSKIKKEIVQKE